MSADLMEKIRAAAAAFAEATGRRAVITFSSDGFKVEYVEAAVSA